MRYVGQIRMLIRAAIASDVEEIAAVHASAIRDVCGQVYEPSEIHAWVSRKTRQGYLRAVAERQVFVALRDDRVVGFSELDPKAGAACLKTQRMP